MKLAVIIFLVIVATIYFAVAITQKNTDAVTNANVFIVASLILWFMGEDK